MHYSVPIGFSNMSPPFGDLCNTRLTEYPLRHILVDGGWGPMGDGDMSSRRVSWGIALLATILVLAGCPKTEYWTHNPVPIPDHNINQWAISAIDVPRSFTIKDLNVTVNVTHPAIGDCDAWLVSAEQEIVPLIFIATGANMVDTTFDDEAAAPIDSGTAPFTGHWQIDSFYVNAGMFMVDGENAKGIWTLNFRDQKAGDVGEITSWGLIFNSSH